jgi:hypothetical protein
LVEQFLLTAHTNSGKIRLNKQHAFMHLAGEVIMIATDTPFQSFVQGLIPSKDRIDPATLQHAKIWYKSFAGSHAVNMADRDLVEIYEDLS